jgi:hypothetical protein
MTFASTTGETGAEMGRSSLLRIRSRLPMPVIAYCPPGLARFPVNSQTSFSK